MTVASIIQTFTSFIPGLRLIDGGDLLSMANQLMSAKSGIVAHSGGTQAAATPLIANFNSVDTVAADNDSVMLPPAIPGVDVNIYNNSAHTLAVFGVPSNPNSATGAGDTIAAHNSNAQQPTATGVTQATTLTATYVCYTAGQWKQTLSA